MFGKLTNAVGITKTAADGSSVEGDLLTNVKATANTALGEAKKSAVVVKDSLVKTATEQGATLKTTVSGLASSISSSGAKAETQAAAAAAPAVAAVEAAPAAAEAAVAEVPAVAAEAQAAVAEVPAAVAADAPAATTTSA